MVYSLVLFAVAAVGALVLSTLAVLCALCLAALAGGLRMRQALASKNRPRPHQQLHACATPGGPGN